MTDEHRMIDLLQTAISLLREACPALHLCRPIQETSQLADFWWKQRGIAITEYEKLQNRT